MYYGIRIEDFSQCYWVISISKLDYLDDYVWSWKMLNWSLVGYYIKPCKCEENGRESGFESFFGASLMSFSWKNGSLVGELVPK